MKDKRDIRGKADWNGDGVTGYTQGANPRSNWITENMGKTILIIIGTILVFSVLLELNTRGSTEPDTPADRQQQASE